MNQLSLPVWDSPGESTDIDYKVNAHQALHDTEQMQFSKPVCYGIMQDSINKLKV